MVGIERDGRLLAWREEWEEEDFFFFHRDGIGVFEEAERSVDVSFREG